MTDGVFTITGIGVLLPGWGTASCTSLDDLMRCVDSERGCLTSLPSHNGLPNTVVGKISNLVEATGLGLNQDEAIRYGRATLLGAAAVRDAIGAAGLDPQAPDERTLLVVASLQYAASELHGMYETLLAGSAADVGMAYWRRGTPPALISGVSTLLDLSWPTLNIAGSCNVGLRALEIGLMTLTAGSADRVVLLGVDSCLDDLFLAGALHLGRSGYQASVTGLGPDIVRPHDSRPAGNASGEGAVALVLERGSTSGRTFHIDLRTVRSSGGSTVATGPASPLAHAAVDLMKRGGVHLDNLAFINDYADGNAFVEEHFISFLDEIRALDGSQAPLSLVNHEGLFGHLAGPGGLIRFLVSLELLKRGTSAQCPNVREVHPGLGSVDVRGTTSFERGAPALIVCSGAGGDATVALVHGGGDR
ncbi:beta-ketoacyl synthase N-terminal-like domain-containing protein [Corynebacterium belfantii]|uniref:3-oxoacyl-ACP synthase n=1 Tax=Corynebacterium belfantii TaxID=2014537 RepID=A0ABS0LEA6_9CORY|nr:beta-ketoacyl synthase N-terminal-like domain-containing protein [Corynebacterium belfantii]OLN14947.1 hypothetical protein BUE64_10110 [Corynebacterium diphtheriae subsp. lausannense]MBG9311358.1 3-oxoacyl-ACP synthase [Corynebacterium belfantii]MBG9329106.1 3-oxoacyl-ACP synthase [Corynebacterium belfantii]MBG9347781.1 3-oxoacyl-ACP synthase [Corynebacterium belfantii]MBG9350254.1 3-oxoacyl-ACP synthase [Corynebacterium belfantii]